MRRWSRRIAASEGWRNWRDGRWVTVALVCFAVLAILLPAAADALVAARIVAAERAWVAAGGRVLVVTNEERGVSMARCEELRGVRGIDAAVAVTRQGGMVATTAAPGARLSVTTVTAGISSFLGIGPIGDGIVLSPPASRDGGPGPWLVLEHRTASGAGDEGVEGAAVPAGPWKVAAIADLGLLGDTHASGVLVPVFAEGTADQCFVRAEAGQVSSLRRVLPAIFGSTIDAPTVVSDRLISGEFGRNYVEEYRDRTTAWLPFVSGAALGFSWLLVRWVKRGQDSLYAAVGADVLARALIRGTEWSLTLLTGAIIGGVLAGWTVVLTGSVLHESLPLLARSVVLTAAAASAVAALWSAVPQRDILASLKDR